MNFDQLRKDLDAADSAAASPREWVEARLNLYHAAPDLARLALLMPKLREALAHAAVNMPHLDQCIDDALAKLDALLEEIEQ